MRILVGHTNQMPQINQHLPLPGREDRSDDILAFGNGYAQVPHEPGMTWRELQAGCPAGWKPDVYIHWSPEYNAIPEGIEDADCLTVAAFGDWNLGGQAIRHVGGAFDMLFADRNGCELLRKAGYANVHYAPLWAHDPSLHRRLPGLSRTIDVLMIGSFNHAVQRERARWLARVARLSRKHRVLLTTGIFGDEYVRAMNCAKIVFNRSIRGEINMRAFEAPACGALLFYEAENTEIRDIFTDREHCVLYSDDNLEDLLAYYLAPENAAERERIAEAGCQRIREHNYAHHFARMLDAVEVQAGTRQAEKPSRVFRFASSEEQTLHRLSHWMYSCNRLIYPKMERLLAAMPETADVANFQAVLQGEWANCLPPSLERETRFAAAIAHARRALEHEPDYLMAQANLGFLCLFAGRQQEGEAVLQQVADTLDASEIAPSRLRGVYFPRRFETFDVEVERVWGAFAPLSPEWGSAMRSLLACHVHATLAEQAFTRSDAAASAQHASKAVQEMPSLGVTQYTLARALEALGQTEDALQACRHALDDAPFLVEAWEKLARLYLACQRPQEAVVLLEEWASILEGCPIYASLRADCDKLRYQARKQLQQANASTPQILRLLAFPDWNRAEDWQAVTRAFANAYRPTDPALLMLRADPVAHPPAPNLLRELEAFLTGEMGLSPSALPNITLLNQPLAAGEESKLFQAANALLTHERAELSPSQRALAEAARLPVWTLEEMAARRAA